ncbi:MAG: M23 family metallopeptidase [Bacteroidales bacterium]|nr:M23 family metallopeptidase [Bacteroidales bacterium]
MQTHSYRLYADVDLNYKKKGIKQQLYNSILLKLLFVLVVTAVFYFGISFVLKQKQQKLLEAERKHLLEQFLYLNQRMSKAEKALLQIQDEEENTYRYVLGLNPLPESMKEAGFGGTNPYSKYEGLVNSDLLISTAKRIDILAKKLAVQSKSFEEIIRAAKIREDKIARIPSILPLDRKKIRKIASPFGMRKHPILRKYKMHKGIDLVAKKGTPVMSTGIGKVIKTGYTRTAGRYVKIDHGYGYVSMYLHLSKILVKKGEKVKRGDVIGLVGNTGRSTGTHLHYEIQINGKAVNPEYFFDKRLLKGIKRAR